MQGKVKITVIATGFLGDEARASAIRRAEWQRQQAAAHEDEPQPVAARSGRAFLRPNQGDLLDLEATDDGFTPNFGKMKDDLDVPAFLRKQMD
jgi:hypothetical protein